jgi:spermidine synthase
VVRAVALLLTLLTGFSGLVYEVSWQKYLAILLGSHSEATAAILAIFLGGLSLGYSLFARLCRRLDERARSSGGSPPLLTAYGIVEAGIGLYALVFPGLFGFAQGLSLWIPHTSEGAGFLLDVALCVLLIGPPTILMGGTIPLLTEALARSLEGATRVHALVYATNTAGAFLGALAAGFVLIPALGLVRVMIAMGAVNLAAGICFLVLGRRRSDSFLRPAAADSPASIPGLASYALAALLAGFAMMSIQTALMRLGALSFGSSEFTFSMVVAVFVLCIALGSFAVSALGDRVRARYLVAAQWILVLLLVLIYPQLENAPYWAYWLRTRFGDSEAQFYSYHAAAFGTLLAVFALPIGVSGALLPLLFHVLRRRVGELGVVAGRLYSWNTVGSTLGALLGGYLLLFPLDLHHVYRVAVAALVLAAVLVSWRVLEPRLGWIGAVAGVVALIGLGLLPRWAPDRLAVGLFRNRDFMRSATEGPDGLFRHLARTQTVRFHDDDPTSTATVWDFSKPGQRLERSIFVNGKSDGSVPGDYPTMSLVALVPALFAEGCERAFVIGYGTGVTVGELAALDCSREVVVAEISSGVLAAAPLFDDANRHASVNPKVRMMRSDAYRSLGRTEEKYDIIASEPSNPWVTGVEMLFSREFLQRARSRLTPGGVYAQWFQLYDVSTPILALVFRTYAEVFGHIAVWYTNEADLILFGFQSAEQALKLERLLERAARPDFAAGLQRSGIQSIGALLAHELVPVGAIHAARLEGDVQSLLRPVLSHRAARAFFVGRIPALTLLPPTMTPEAAAVGARNSLLRRYALQLGGELPDPIRQQVIRETCESLPRQCATLLAQWTASDPDSPGLDELMAPVRAKPDWPANRDLIGNLAKLYRDGAGPGGGALTPGIALEFFEPYYHHAAPFPRAAVSAALERCPGGAEACIEQRRAIEARIGPLD